MKPQHAATLVFVTHLTVAAAEARPIRTNTPGTGVFIGSGLLSQVVCDSRSGDRAALFSCEAVIDFRYAPATHWVVGLRAPLHVERQLEIDGRKLSRSGLGDVEISGKWRFFRQVGPWFDRHAAVEAGVKLPTGESDGVNSTLPRPFARRLNPGTGSTDAFVDLIYQQGQRRFIWGGDLFYRYNGESRSGYRSGAELRLSFDLEYIAFPREYTKPGSEVFLLLEGALVHRFEDEVSGRDLATGGTEFLLAPGIQHVATEQMLLSLSFQLPIWSDVDASGLESDWNLLAEMRFAF